MTDYGTVVNLISWTTTSSGLKVACRLDKRTYPVGKTVSKQEWELIDLIRDEFQVDWNYRGGFSKVREF